MNIREATATIIDSGSEFDSTNKLFKVRKNFFEFYSQFSEYKGGSYHMCGLHDVNGKALDCIRNFLML